jgi:hypothetical protein
MGKVEEHTRILSITTLEGVGRISIRGWELFPPRWSWQIDGMVAVSMEPSPIHKRPFLLPCPASTATSGTNGATRGSTSGSCTSANLRVNGCEKLNSEHLLDVRLHFHHDVQDIRLDQVPLGMFYRHFLHAT